MASLRERPFVSKPSDALKARMEQARQGGFFVVQTPGPTSFVLKSDQESKKLKVNIGSVHSCSCGAREQPCVHVAFVLLRVFRLEPTDQRCWQASLTDSELEALVDSRARAAAIRRREPPHWAAAVTVLRVAGLMLALSCSAITRAVMVRLPSLRFSIYPPGRPHRPP